ncbi:MAG: M23 family metallopeptidase [Syntrophorhabdales bacterium]|jgi:hypothetical protein
MDRPPSLPEFARKTRFTEHMVRENGLHEKGFAGWVFLPGMLFWGKNKWWGDESRRVTPHEGLDFSLYEDREGGLFRLGAGSRVPVMYDGIVVGIVDDFLGKTIIMEHRFPQAPALALVTVYGHTKPALALRPGRAFRAGEVMASIASQGASNKAIDPHLHVSLGQPSGAVALGSLNWQNMLRGLVMFDPFEVVDGPSRVHSPP